jgi:hypothetical protein
MLCSVELLRYTMSAKFYYWNHSGDQGLHILSSRAICWPALTEVIVTLQKNLHLVTQLHGMKAFVTRGTYHFAWRPASHAYHSLYSRGTSWRTSVWCYTMGIDCDPISMSCDGSSAGVWAQHSAVPKSSVIKAVCRAADMTNNIQFVLKFGTEVVCEYFSGIPGLGMVKV